MKGQSRSCLTGVRGFQDTRTHVTPFGYRERVTEDELRDICMALPMAEETYPFGEETTVFKVVGKIFTLGDLTRRSISLKIDPEDSIALRADFPGVIIPGYHLNKKHWITVDTDRVPDDLVADLIRNSYSLVAPRRGAAPAARASRHPDGLRCPRWRRARWPVPKARRS
jgi:predicted DNA-binding protein (MmcQ/YjbR family)